MRLRMFLPVALGCVMLTACGSVDKSNPSDIQSKTVETGKGADSAGLSAEDAIVSVNAIGFVEEDGSKLKAIVVEYSQDMSGAEITDSTYEITDYGTSLDESSIQLGSDPGAFVKAYVNDLPETSENGGSGSGNYVIIEVNTDYQVNRYTRSYEITMAAGVTQKEDIVTDNGIISASDVEKNNYEYKAYTSYDANTGENREPEYYNFAIEGSYTIEGIEDYELHKIEAGTAFKATNCFDEANGEYWDLDLPYAIYVPEDYDPSKKYALVLHIHDAGSMSSDPMLTLCESQAASNYASEEFQQMAKDQGLGGAIIVCPAVAEFYNMDEENPNYYLRMSRDNYTLSCAAPAIWELMDEITSEYSIDTDRIYGSGQSMGGMTVMAMAAQRDNYFAALLPMSCKWGNNYNKDYEFNGETYFNAPQDGTIIWKEDSDGNEVDYNNWFYLTSDDNILYLNTEGENVEYRFLYKDLCGIDVNTAEMYLDETSTEEKRNEIVKDLVSQPNELGIYQVVMSGEVGHMSAWFYGHGTSAVYEWLLSQTRETEMEREKLALDKPYEFADVQLETDDRIYYQDRNGSDEKAYYPTGAEGAGTADYNYGLSALGSRLTIAPGWTPETAENMTFGQEN